MTVGPTGRSASPEVAGAEEIGGELRFPDFYVIGAQKAATTWLHTVLSGHGSLWLPPVKELGYFNELHVPSHVNWTRPQRRRRAQQGIDRLCRQAKAAEVEPSPSLDLDQAYLWSMIGVEPISDEWYGRIFRWADTAQVCGEVNPAYALLPEAGFEHLLRLCPDARFVFVIRDPIERAWAHIRMLLRNRPIATDATTRLARNPAVLEWSRYSATYRRLAKLVPEARVKTIIYDDLSDAPAGEVQNLLRFLEVSPDGVGGDDLAPRMHVGRTASIDSQTLEALRGGLEHEYGEMESYSPRAAELWRKRHFS